MSEIKLQQHSTAPDRQHQQQYQLNNKYTHHTSNQTQQQKTKSVYARVPIEKNLGDVSYTRFLVDCRVSRFFSHQKNWDLAQSISNEYSGRLIDFLIIIYSKIFSRETTYRRLVTPTIVSAFNPQRYEFIHIYSKYQTTLQIYGKQYMDIYRRGPEYFIASPSNPSEIWQTTIRQANMYRWLIENNVHLFLNRHSKEIRRAMEYSAKHNQSLKGFTPDRSSSLVEETEADITIVPLSTMTFHFASSSTPTVTDPSGVD